MFTGTHIVGVDARGRFSIPAEFRAELGAMKVHVWPSLEGGRLEAGGEARLQTLHAALAGMGEFDDERADLEILLFSDMKSLPIDETGRALLPAELRAAAGIADRAVFVGKIDKFEIWAPDALEAAKTAARARRQERGRS